MSDYMFCCNGCFKQIAQRSTAAARLWLEICSFDKDGDAFITEESYVIRFLELWGYITTTETNEAIFIRVNGKHDEDGTTFYCCGECDE